MNELLLKIETIKYNIIHIYMCIHVCKLLRRFTTLNKLYTQHIYIFMYLIYIISNLQAKDELQWIAVWQLLYHLQHLACHKSRLQLILGIVIVLNNVFIYI